MGYYTSIKLCDNWTAITTAELCREISEALAKEISSDIDFL